MLSPESVIYIREKMARARHELASLYFLILVYIAAEVSLDER